jgi:hypothetical protein
MKERRPGAPGLRAAPRPSTITAIPDEGAESRAVRVFRVFDLP